MNLFRRVISLWGIFDRLGGILPHGAILARWVL